MKPGPILTIRNTFQRIYIRFYFSIILFRKYKNIFTFLHTQTKPKNIITALYLLHCIFIYFIAFVILFYFTYIYNLCLTTTRWNWGQKKRKLFCRLLEEEWQELWTVPLEFDNKPWVLLWGKIYSCYNTLHLESQRVWHLCLVSSDEVISLHEILNESTRGGF
jgi:hypothetical protein